MVMSSWEKLTRMADCFGWVSWMNAKMVLRGLSDISDLVLPGDGHSVNVWEDYWLEDHRRLGPKPDNCEVTYVRDLLNNEACFINRLRPDTLYWHSSPGGLFSTKSAYYLALESAQHMVENVCEESTTLLRAIWNANVPNKIKLFLWRAWKNYLPTINNLQARGLNLTSVSCTHCDQVGEDVIHVLFKCPSARQVWDRCNFDRFYDTDGAVTLDDFCQVFLNKFPMEWENFLMILWGLWRRRNKQFHGQESGKAGLGFVARNDRGDVLFSGARVECYASSPLEAEAKSLLWATKQAHNKGYPKVIFESDSLCLVNALQRGTTLLQIASMLAQIISNSLSFSLCNWSFVKREGNKVAHSIASWALECNDELILEGGVPNCACIWATNDVLSSIR
ncbi:reverse transcriptase [Artemisia annua]|uniref:Reverse transcriptase n=1 Tax=Artemisia annua TaxID=35608 RepID=A0A2U1LXE0_ARTAN|nr:reverse transcriptase [Artemisia annua]